MILLVNSLSPFLIAPDRTVCIYQWHACHLLLQYRVVAIHRCKLSNICPGSELAALLVHTAETSPYIAAALDVTGLEWTATCGWHFLICLVHFVHTSVRTNVTIAAIKCQSFLCKLVAVTASTRKYHTYYQVNTSYAPKWVSCAVTGVSWHRIRNLAINDSINIVCICIIRYCNLYICRHTCVYQAGAQSIPRSASHKFLFT